MHIHTDSLNIKLFCCLVPVHSLWNNEYGFFQANTTILSTLGAVTCGYISAVWPLILILLVSLAMELNKRDFKVAVYPWKFIDRVSFGVVKQWFKAQLFGISGGLMI